MKRCSRKFRKIHTEKHLCQSLFFFFEKETLARVSSCEFCEIHFHNEYNISSHYTARKMKFSVKDFFNKCDQIRSFLRSVGPSGKDQYPKNITEVFLNSLRHQ